MKHPITAPIGIFDSGSGGLTVTKSIAHAFPEENILYFGDTAHAPWGDKSIAAIQGFALKICDVLLKHHCKIILIACHTASAIAFDLVKEYVAGRALVLNVVDPVIHHLCTHYPNKKVGLIGTKQTVRSNIYTKKLDSCNANIELTALPTPLLVPLIEEGFANTEIAKMVVHTYLSNSKLEGISSIILGCTHYPFIKQHIENFYNGTVDIIDASTIITQLLKETLEKNNLLNSNKLTNAKRIFFVSDYNEFFAQTATMFFSDDIQLEPYPLWE